MSLRAVGPARRIVPRCLILGALLVVSSVGVTRSASASPVDDKRKEAQKIASQIDSLQNQSFDLGAEYDRVESELTKVDAEGDGQVAGTTTQITIPRQPRAVAWCAATQAASRRGRAAA